MDHTKNTEGKSAFIKRRTCLMKKASELAILCDSEVALFGYSNDGELFEYASSNMVKILTRLEKCRRIKQGIPVNNDPERDEDLLREETEKLKQDNDRHVLGMDLERMCHKDLRELEEQLNEGLDLERMCRKDLRELEEQLNEGLLCIKDRKEAILVQQLERSKDQEQRYIQENETLRRKVEQLERHCASTIYQQPRCVGYQMMALSKFVPVQVVYGPQMACNTSTGDANSVDDVSLQLGPSTSKVCGKRKTPHEGRSNADTFLTLQDQDAV